MFKALTKALTEHALTPNIIHHPQIVTGFLGAGKTTLLAAIARRGPVTSGDVRYNGELLEDSVFVELKPYMDIITVCPEVQMGMPVPRPPIQIHQAEKPILFQPSTSTDLSYAMAKLCDELSYEEIDGFLLKARSPSCGVVDTPHYEAPPSQEQKPGKSEPGQGLFTYIVSEKYPKIVFCDEDRFTQAIYRAYIEWQINQIITIYWVFLEMLMKQD
mgnify:CR=1 FL=1